MRKYLFIIGALFLAAAPYARGEVSLTVYNGNLGLVRDVREVELGRGVRRLDFHDVAAQIDPTSARLAFPSERDGVTLLEQNFEYDLVSHEKLLEKYLGKEIELERRAGKDGEKKETVKGTLLSAAGGLVVQSGDRILLNPSGEISLARLPEGLVLKPTLSCLVQSEVSGRRKAELDYLTGGITWNADYVAVASADDKRLELTAWVTIDNRSGADYPDAALKLIAGDLNRVQPARNAILGMGQMMMKDARAPQFEEKSFFEYHLYTLQRKTTLKNNETKQIEFTRAAGVPLRKVYVYDGAAAFGRVPYQAWSRADMNFGAQSNTKVAVKLEFRNAKANNLGIPLPGGKIRVYKADTDGALEFIGEDYIDHTPKDEPVRASLGDAFDIVGERVQTDFKCGNDWCEESFRITVRNHKDEAVAVTAVERLYRWSNWKLTARSDEYVKKDFRTVEFPVQVPANGEKTVTYTVRYWW
ncbi:MAG: DUF4139 domain-containing protein [Endomicrobiales bacterium]